MVNTTIPVALLSGLTLIAGATFAAETVLSSNPERNAVTQIAPNQKTSAAVAQERIDFARNPVSADGWQDVGGERGWALVQHRYDWIDGKLVHTDRFEHNAPKVSRSMSEQDRNRDRQLHGSTR